MAFLEKRNNFQEAKNFQKSDSDSRNFQAVMEWLRDIVDLSDFAYQYKVNSNLTIKYGNAAAGLKAKTERLACYIYEWQWQREKQE